MATVSTATATSPDGPATATAAYSGPPRGNGTEKEAGVKRKVAGWRHFVAGGVGGMTGAIVTSPFDVVKTRLQSDLFKEASHPQIKSLHSSYFKTAQSHTSYEVAASLAHAQQYARAARPTGASGLLWNFVETAQMIRNIYVHEGPRALFKGLGPTLIGVVPARAINFSTYAQSKQFLAASLPHNVTLSSTSAAEASPVVHLGAAAIAGIMTATATNPIWVIKTRLQLEAKHQERILANGTSTRAAAAAAAAAPGKKSIGMLPAFTMTKDILAKEGLKGLYKGMSASYLGVTEGVIQWVLYERLKKISTQTYPGEPTKSRLAEWLGIVGSSGGAKMVASLITYPHEVLRTRLRQPTEPGARGPKYTGLVQTLKLVIKEEGAASLYGGLSAHLMRVVPNAACMFTIYELAVRL
ncbi:Pyrimidine nucleotide transporter, mitochondrial [Naganishia albida]|nr:Pyrimidine nucleotide transporter, mitochondrial [Naganishia albida]